MNKITIKDVAREAGVAISTASNALNGSHLVNEETRARILETASRLNYVPNLNGRYLKSGKSMLLGFFTCSVKGYYFTVLMDAMSKECERLGYSLNVFVSMDQSVIMNHILGKSFDGIFIYEGERIKDAEIKRIKDSSIKTVFLDRPYQGNHISSVIFDSYQSGYEAAKYLVNLGHKRIGFIEGPPDVFDSMERKRGCMDALREYDLQLREEDVICGMFEELYTYNAVTTFCRNRRGDFPKAIIAGNDHSAVGCIKALKSEGIRVPEDVSVVGFDDIEIAEYFSPPLTTIRNPIVTQGIKAVKQMIDMIDKEKKGTSQLLSGELIIRKSSGVNYSDSQE